MGVDKHDSGEKDETVLGRVTGDIINKVKDNPGKTAAVVGGILAGGWLLSRYLKRRKDKTPEKT